MRKFWVLGILGIGLFLAGTASAASISMNPGSVSLNALSGNDFTIIFDGGDTDDNILNFTAQGGGCRRCISTSVAALVFDDADVIAAGDSSSGFFNPNNVVRGIVTPGGNLAGLLIDTGAPSSEAFWAQLDNAPTTATFYSLNFDNIDSVKSLNDIVHNVIDRARVKFTTVTQAVPEPSAAMVFGVGLLVTGRALRQR